MLGGRGTLAPPLCGRRRLLSRLLSGLLPGLLVWLRSRLPGGLLWRLPLGLPTPRLLAPGLAALPPGTRLAWPLPGRLLVLRMPSSRLSRVAVVIGCHR